jgi:hypothetical protein
MSHRRLAALALATSSLVMMSCGGSRSTPTPTSTQSKLSGQTEPAGTTRSSTITKPIASKSLAPAALIAKTNAICRRLNKQTATVTISSPQDIARTAPRLAGYYRTALADLRKLTPPTAFAADWKAMATDIQTVAEESLTAGRFAADNDLSSVGRVDNNVTGIQRNRFAIAERNGIKDCAEL